MSYTLNISLNKNCIQIVIQQVKLEKKKKSPVISTNITNRSDRSEYPIDTRIIKTKISYARRILLYNINIQLTQLRMIRQDYNILYEIKIRKVLNPHDYNIM